MTRKEIEIWSLYAKAIDEAEYMHVVEAKPFGAELAMNRFTLRIAGAVQRRDEQLAITK